MGEQRCRINSPAVAALQYTARNAGGRAEVLLSYVETCGKSFRSGIAGTVVSAAGLDSHADQAW